MNLLAALGLVADAPAAPAQGLDSAHPEDGAAAGFALAFEGAAVSREEAAAAALALLRKTDPQTGAQRPAARLLLAIEAQQGESAAEMTDTEAFDLSPGEHDLALTGGDATGGEEEETDFAVGTPDSDDADDIAADAKAPSTDRLADVGNAAAPDPEAAHETENLVEKPAGDDEETGSDAAPETTHAEARDPDAQAGPQVSPAAAPAPAPAPASESDAAGADRQDQNRLTAAAGGAADMTNGDPQAQADGEPAGDKPPPFRPAAQTADAGVEQPAALRESPQREGLQVQAARIDAARAAPVLQHAHEAEAARQVVAAIKADGARDVIDVRLEPPDLGRVRIHFHLDRIDGVTATVSSDRDETLDLLRRHSADLQRELERAGFANVQLAFSSGGERGPASASAGELGLAGAAAEETQAEETVRYVRRSDRNLDRLV